MPSKREDRTDYVALIEATYELDGSDDQWLQRICDLAAPSLDAGMGAFAFCYDLREGSDRMSPVVGTGLGPERSDVLQDMIRQCPPDELRAFCGQRINCGAGSTRFAARNLSYEALFATHARGGIRDARYATVPVGRDFGIMLGGYTREPASVPPGTIRMWLKSLCHLAIGLRLRRNLRRHSIGSGNGEAVLHPDGRVAHAEGDAKPAPVRAALRAAARRIDRARGRLRRDDPARALELWRGLVSGRWSLVDRFESDGRRYLVAHPNPPEVMDLRGLSLREQQVARLVSRGYAIKLIAYELGVGPSTVSNQLASMRRKLGVGSTAELIRLLHVLTVPDADVAE